MELQSQKKYNVSHLVLGKSVYNIWSFTTAHFTSLNLSNWHKTTN